MADEVNTPYIIGRVFASNNVRHVTENSSDNKNKKKQDNEKKKKETVENDNGSLFDSDDVNSLTDEKRRINVKI